MKPTWCTIFLSILMFINLYMFWVTTGPSSGDTTVFMRHFTCYSVWMTVWYAGWPPCVPDRRLININTLRKTVHQVAFICKIIERCMVNKT